MHAYSAYGLEILSAIPFPGLDVGAPAPAYVVIRLGSVEGPHGSRSPGGDDLHFTPGEARLYWEGLAAFLVRDGAEIIVEPYPGAELGLVRNFLLGMVLAVLLHQRGLIVLHASAVAMNGGAVAFVGGRGWGKSTLAATLYALGHGLIADDVVAVELDDSGQATAIPAFPQFKLWPDAIASLGQDPESMPRISSAHEKRLHRATNGFSTNSTALKHIYVLGKGPSPEIEPLGAGEAVIELISNSHIARFEDGLPIATQGSHLASCARLAKSVPVFRLRRPDSLALMPAMVQLVREHAAPELYRATAV